MLRVATISIAYNLNSPLCVSHSLLAVARLTRYAPASCIRGSICLEHSFLRCMRGLLPFLLVIDACLLLLSKIDNQSLPQHCPLSTSYSCFLASNNHIVYLLILLVISTHNCKYLFGKHMFQFILKINCSSRRDEHFVFFSPQIFL